MMSRAAKSGLRKATNLSIDTQLLGRAKALKVNVSRAAEEGIATAIARRQAELWLAENAQAIESANEFVEERGLPLDKYRLF